MTFAEAATSAPVDAPYIVSYGMMTWVTPSNRAQLLAAVERHLSGNGVAIISYHCLPGWKDILSFQQLALRMSNQMLRDGEDRFAQTVERHVAMHAWRLRREALPLSLVGVIRWISAKPLRGGEARMTIARRPIAWSVVAASAAMSLAGCATQSAMTEPSAAIDVPESFVAGAAEQGVIAERWWERFDDPQLNALVEQALADNPSIEQAAARLRQARATARIERADLLPAIDLGLGALESGGGSAIADLSLYDVDLAASWEADLWGRISANTAAARADALASEADLEAIRQLIAAEVARTYFAVVETQAQVALSQRVLGTYDELIRQLDLRVAVEVTPRSTAALARTDSESALAGLEAQRETYARLIRRLEILLGDYPQGAASTAAGLPEMPARPAVGLPAELLARRPDLRSARAGIEAAGFRVDAAEAALLPSLTLTGSTGLAGPDAGDLFDTAFSVWSIAGRLLQPIFQGGRLRAAIEFREGERDEAIAFYAETALQALLEVETALAVEDLLTRQEAAFDRSASAAEEATRISVLRYEAGIESFFNVLESQQRALAARSAAIAARRARLDNRIDLHLALGGDLGYTFPNGTAQ